MEFKEWLKKNQNWITFSLIFLFVIWYRSSNDKSGSTNSIPNNNQNIETPIQPPVLNQQEIEENKIKQEKEEKVRKNEQEKERIKRQLLKLFLSYCVGIVPRRSAGGCGE